MRKSTLAGSRAAGLLGVALLAAALGARPADAAARRRPAAPHSTPKRAGAADSNQVLVQIGREAITRADVQRRIESLPEQFRANYASPEGRQQLLDRMIEERVWMTLAIKSGVADRAQVKQQLDQQRRDLLVRTYLNEVMASNAAPSDSEGKTYYAAHGDDYKVPATVTVRHILSKTEADAKRVKQWAKAKQDWNMLVKRYSADTLTRASGGSLGAVSLDGAFPSLGAQPALAESAFALAEGAIGGPYKTDKGWHVIKVEAKKAESIRPFEQVRPMIMRQITSQRSQEFYKTKLEDARRALGVKPDSAAIKGFISQRKSARDMFNEAQAIGAADERISAYRKLLEQYPDSDVSPQAQFMVGFIYSEELKNYTEAEKAFRALLQRYPKAELAPSAEWMLQHMREENAPSFISLDTDSTASAGTPGASSLNGKPSASPRAIRGIRPWSPPAKGDSAGRAGRP